METQTTAPQTPTERVGTVGHETKQAAGDVASTATQEATQVAREAKDQVQRLWGQARADLTEQAATQQTRVAGGLRELADQLGTMARSADQDGLATGLVDDVARRAGDAASWLDQRDPGSLLDEARGFARRRPGTFLAVAAGVGVLAGRLSRSLVDEARDSDDTSSSSSAAQPGSVAGAANGSTASSGNGYGAAAGYGTGSAGSTGTGGGLHTATDPTASTTSSLPVTPGAAPAVVSEGNATMPGEELPDAHRTTQPMAPDGTPSPIDSDGHLTADDDAGLRGER